MTEANELSRLREMYVFENEELRGNKKIICGIDEAGRGPLAGPVVSSAVVLPILESEESFLEWVGLNDSKKLSAKKRERLHEVLFNHPNVRIGIGIVSEKTIDDINILKATQVSMRKAIENLGLEPDCLLVDGINLPGVKHYQRKIIGGDALSLSVAAASVIAKVTRDAIMTDLHEKYPQYGFNKHKGYGTKEHIKNIRLHGPCEIHRKTFYPISLSGEIGV